MNISSQTLLERLNAQLKQRDILVKEFEQIYTKIYGNFIYNDDKYIGNGVCFNQINSINKILEVMDGIFIEVNVECPDEYEDYTSDDDLCLFLPLDLFSNYNKYLENRIEQEKLNKELNVKRQADNLKQDIYEKAQKLHELTENKYCEDIQTLLEMI